MPKTITFKKPSKIKGQSKVSMHLKVDPIDKLIIQEFAARQTKNSGITVSPANVLVTTFYQTWREEYKEKLRRKKEVVNGRRYIDGIK